MPMARLLALIAVLALACASAQAHIGAPAFAAESAPQGLLLDPATASTAITAASPHGVKEKSACGCGASIGRENYLRARWMDPSVGRFTQLDPFAGDPTQPLHSHKFVYVAADPINHRDPSGLFGGVFGIMDIGFSQIRVGYARASSAKRAYATFDVVRRSLCRSCDGMMRTASHGHHLFPKFMGGNQVQDLARLPEPIHQALHRLLHIALVANGFPHPNKAAYRAIFEVDPRARDRALRVLVNTTKFIDKVCVGRIKPPLTPRLKRILRAHGIRA